MKIRINHDDLKLGARGTQSYTENQSGAEIKREYLDAHNKAIIIIKRDSEGLEIELDSDYAEIIEE